VKPGYLAAPPANVTVEATNGGPAAAQIQVCAQARDDATLLRVHNCTLREEAGR